MFLMIIGMETRKKKKAKQTNQKTIKKKKYKTIRSDEGLTPETSAMETLYGGQFTSNYLIKQK